MLVLTSDGPRWLPIGRCTLLSDDELLLIHSAHPPYSASITTAMITGIGSAPTPQGMTLHLRVLGREFVLRHTDPRVIQRWEATLQQRAMERRDSPRHREQSSPSVGEGGAAAAARNRLLRQPSATQHAEDAPWKAGTVRLVNGDRAAAVGTFDEEELLALPASHGEITREGVLEVRRPPERAWRFSEPLLPLPRPLPFAADPSRCGLPSRRSQVRQGVAKEAPLELRLPLASLLSVRLLPPYRPILELRTEEAIGFAEGIEEGEEGAEDEASSRRGDSLDNVFRCRGPPDELSSAL